MSAPIPMRNYGFQTAPMPSVKTQQAEVQDREERSSERNMRIGKVIGLIIGGIGLVGVVVVPSVAIGGMDNRVVGFVGGVVSLGVAYLGFSLAIQASDNYPCCNSTINSESDFLAV